MTEVQAADIQGRLAAVRQALDAAADRAGRRVELMAVSKTFPAEAVEAAAAAGQRIFGENYAQEGCAKIEALRAAVAEHFDWVDSVDRLKIAERLSSQRPETMPDLNIMIEVNIDGEASKSGVAPGALEELLEAVRGLPRLKLRGLMTIPAPAQTHDEQMKPLAAMRALFDRLAPRYGLDVLSMGMSADMLTAVEAGSTMVRVGSAIFGPRHYPGSA